MRITFVIPEPSLSGGMRAIAQYGQLLMQRGHQVVMVTPNRRPTMREAARALLRERRWPWGQCPQESHLDGRGITVIKSRGREVVDGDVPDSDVVIATWWETAEWVSRLSETKGAKAYFVQHDEQVWYDANRIALKNRAAATWHLPLHKIVVSKWLEGLACQRCPGEVVSYAPYGVDYETFRSPPRGKQPVPTVGFMYSEPLFKGTDLMVAAIEEARASVPDLRAVAFGMHDLVPHIPLPVNCHYVKCPAQQEIPRLYAMCDAWLMLSRSEGFGLPLLESMACGTPMIASAAGASPEIIADGGGYMVPIDNVTQAVDAILRIARMSDGEWHSLSLQARKNAEQYSWEAAVERIERTLRQIAQKQLKTLQLS